MAFILGLFFVLNSCSTTKDLGLGLQGEWALTKVLCHCAFDEDVDFSTSKLWFATNQTKVTVIHEAGVTYFHDSGNYRYTIQKDTITISDSPRRYTYTIEGNSLTLTYIDNPMIADDEVSYTYVRK